MSPTEKGAIPIGRGPGELDLSFAGWNASLHFFVTPHEHLVLRLAHAEGARKLEPDAIEEVFIGFIGGFPRLPRWKVSSFQYHYDADLDQYVVVDRKADVQIEFGTMVIGTCFDWDAFGTRGIFSLRTPVSLYDNHPQVLEERGHPGPDRLDEVLYG